MYDRKPSRYPYLFSPAKIGQMEVPNRIVMAPMATSFASAGGEVTDWMIEYYRQRSRGGVALIIVENANVDHPTGVSGTTQLRVDKDRFIPSLYRLTQALHVEGALCALQINHAGAVAKKALEEGVQPVAPSPGPQGLYLQSPRLLETDEITEIVHRFAQAALRAKQGGFDAVEIHGAHAYLIAQFLSPLTNQRNDKYGGELACRARFALNIVEETRRLIGPDFPILFRLNVTEFLKGGLELSEATSLATMLTGAGVDALDLTVGTHYQVNRSACSLIEPMSYEQGWRLDMVSRVKRNLEVPVIAVGPIRDPQKAEEALRKGNLDLVSLGRPLIADPYWPTKSQLGTEQEIRHCISCNEGCVRPRLFENRPISCAVNPQVGLEGTKLKSAKASPRSILVVGGGPAGCTVAIYARQRGHAVVLVEKNSELGGNCLLGSKLLHKEKLARVKDYHQLKLNQLGVELQLKRTFSLDLLTQLNPEVLVWAAGAEPFIPSEIETHERALLHAEEAIRRGLPWEGRRLAMIGGGAVGCEVALTLASMNNRITILEMLDSAAREVEPLTRFDLLDRIQNDSRIKLLTGTPVRRVIGNKIEYQGKKCDLESLNVDHIIWATGYSPRPEPQIPGDRFPDLEIIRIGDSFRPRNVFHAVREGFWLGVRI